MKITHPYHTRGQSLVEMALLLPVLLLLSVVTLDLGRGIYYYSVIYNAAREGARYGIVHQEQNNTVPNDVCGIEKAARNLAIGLDPDKLSVLVSSPIISDTLQVKVTYTFELVTPIAKFIRGCGCNDFNLQASSTMMIER
jgi:Flp pilus assembly protein TadG